MKPVYLLFFSLILSGCSEKTMEEFAFRKSLEYSLIDKCDEQRKDCELHIQQQIKPCMEKSSWRDYLNNKEDEAELKRFTTEFYACIVDSDGLPYFESNL